MGYDMLIDLLDQLPEEKRREVYDFAAFISQRDGVENNAKPTRYSLADKIRNPLLVDGFVPLSRDEIYAR
jgi:hypothetical protein